VETESKIPNLSNAFEAHIAEYKALRDEILQDLNLQHQLIQFVVALNAAGVTLFFLGDPVLARQEPFILLLVSILLSALSLATADLGYAIQDISYYIQATLTPKVQSLVGEAKNDRFVVFKWEEAMWTKTPRLAFRGITSAAKYLISFVPSVFMIFTFYAFRKGDNGGWAIHELILFILAVIMAFLFLLSVIFGMPFVTSRLRNQD
jgi:hypothetical protein